MTARRLWTLLRPEDIGIGDDLASSTNLNTILKGLAQLDSPESIRTGENGTLVLMNKTVTKAAMHAYRSWLAVLLALAVLPSILLAIVAI